METPKNIQVLGRMRKHTPRLSERKKKLFDSEKIETDIVADFGLTPIIGLMDENKGSRRNLGIELAETYDNTNAKISDEVAEEQLERLFTDSMDLGGEHQRAINKSNEKRKYDLIQSPQESLEVKRRRNSTLCISTTQFYKMLPESNEKKKRCATNKNSALEENMHKNTKSNIARSYGSSLNINRGVRHKIRKSGHHHIPPLDINRILKNVRNKRLQNLIHNERQIKEQIEIVHSILRSNEDPIAMARPLTVMSNTNDNNNNVEHISSTLGEFSDIDSDDDTFISEANVSKQLGVEMEPIIPLINHAHNETNHVTNGEKRKFFKSGYTTNIRKEIQIMGKIKATVDKGKILLKQDVKEKRSKFKIRSTDTNEFSKEQATVNKILESLDNTTFSDNNSFAEMPSSTNVCTESTDANKLTNLEIDFSPMTAKNYEMFRQRLPYQTNDSVIIEQQYLLLEFLISNNICTEEHFKIFITDPDNHKEEAARIIDNLVEVVQEQNEDFRMRLPYKTTTPEVIAQQYKHIDFLIENNICTEETFDIFIVNYEKRHEEAEKIINRITAQNNLLQTNTELTNNSDGNQNATCHVPENIHMNTVAPNENSKKNNMEQELFPIFYQGRCQPLIRKSTRNVQRFCIGGEGMNQYQIDAGQKNFGAQQCKQCGLVYTVHEPEEEKLHRDYHASQHIMRFKSWINEDVVAYYPEWGSNDGRIIRLTDSSHIKRQERLKEVLNIVDKELGFSTYIIPKIFVAFLAIYRNHIVGLCLVQPLEKANKFICVNGVDCYTEEEFQAKCGISRIWVSPLHRRMQIASKMIQAVQLNTIFGEEIPLNKIAFSAPTISGKLFAQKITKMENFLTYQ